MKALPPTLRIPFVRRCVVEGDDGSKMAMLLDLSLRGAYIAADELPEPGDSVVVRFRVPDNMLELAVSGTVAWIQSEKTHPVHGLPCGFGVRFTKLEIEDVRRIARTIQNYCLSNPIYRQYL